MLGTGIIRGMYTTIKEAFGRRLTVNYPWEKREPYERFRGSLAVSVAESGEALCTACGVCVQSCPDRIIRVERDPEVKLKAKELSIEVSRCMFCGLCEEACKFGAIRFVPDYEFATYDKADIARYYLIKDGQVVRPAPPRDGAPEPVPTRVPGERYRSDPSILHRWG